MSQDTKNQSIQSGFSHSFDTGIATQLGLHAAIVFNHIVYWLRINAKKKDCILIDGKVWMYEKQKDMADFFGYLSEDEIYKAIKKLVESGILIKDNHNPNPFDKTSWYTTSDQSIIIGNQELNKSLRNRQSTDSDSVNRRIGERPSTDSSIQQKTINKESKKSDLIEPQAGKIKIFDFEGKEQILTKEDLFSLAVKNRTDWKAQEIEFIYERLAKHKGNVRDLNSFCEAIVKKERIIKNIDRQVEGQNKCNQSNQNLQMNKLKSNSHEKKKENGEKITQNNTNLTTLEEGIKMRPFANWKETLMN